jgi:MoaA/NifB/PqqE/SkfB family radical SAM enzyme
MTYHPAMEGMDAVRWSNILRLEQGYAAGQARIAARPLEAYIEVAARCNLRCAMCPIIVDPRYQPAAGRPGLLAPELFDRLEPVFPTLRRAYLFGLGEPVLHPDLVSFSERLAAAGVEVWITTNATLIDDELAESLARAGTARITVSIDGATPATYERIRKRGRFADAVRGLRALGAARQRHGRPLLYLSLVGMASNLEEVPALVDLCAEVGGDGVFVEGLYPYPHSVIEEWVRQENLGHLGAERVEEIVAQARLRAAFLGVELITRMEEIAAQAPGDMPSAAPVTVAVPAPADGPPREELKLPWACSEPWMTINVNAAGEVRPCCFNDDVLGDLNHGTLEEIWNGPGYTGLRADQAAGRVSAGCEVCVRNSRVKQSPYLMPRETAAPSEAEPQAIVDLPSGGDLVEGSLVVVGRIAAGGERQGERSRLPEVWLDHTLLAALGDCAMVDGGQFAAVIPIPFVSEGGHRLSFRPLHAAEREAFGHRYLQTSGLRDGLAAVSRLAVPVVLRDWEPRPAVRLDGRPHAVSRWLCAPHGAGWMGVAVLDLRRVAPGSYRVDLFFTQHPPFHQRIVRLDLAGT